MKNVTSGWSAVWDSKPWLEPGQEYFLDKNVVEQVSNPRLLGLLEVLSCDESESKTAPPAPFKTSTMQQAASNALKFKPKRSMEIAQKLYEGGHITYMRTDSLNLSQEAFGDIRAFCLEHDLPVVAKQRTWKNKAGAQEAHEAIRPTHFEQEEAGDNNDERALYRLIRLRALASQLEEAVFAVRKACLKGEIDGKEVIFVATGRTLLSKGWKTILDTDQSEGDNEAEADNPVPALRPGSKMQVASSGRVLLKKTKPPKRYTEASLIGELERLGIGRPSTYAAIMENITEREYIKNDPKGFLIATPEGETLVATLKPEFSFVKYDFTKILEDSLDDIAAGKIAYLSLMQSTQKQLEQELRHFNEGVKACEDCASPLRRRKGVSKTGKAYDFWGCSNRDCTANYHNENGLPGAKQAPCEDRPKPTLSEHNCSNCGKPLINRQGRKKDDSGDYNFWSCSDYPKCTASYFDDNGKPGKQWKNKK